MEKIDIKELTAFKIGQAQDFENATGCTVIICGDGAVCGVDVRGGSPGTRDTDALDPRRNRKVVHAVLFAGGSSFGLDAAGGVMRFLEKRGIGRDVGVTRVPNVCAAILFDLKCGSWQIRPDGEMGYAAAESAFSGAEFKSGCFGAGTGATIGKARDTAGAMKGGIGCAAFRHEKLMVGAVAAVNSVGDVVSDGKIIAGTLSEDGRGFAGSESLLLRDYQAGIDLFAQNTVLVCVMTNARIDKAGANRLAGIGQNGVAGVVRPAHSIFDGDTVFAMCSGEVNTSPDAVGILARHAVEAAILDAVISAEPGYGYPAAGDIVG